HTQWQRLDSAKRQETVLRSGDSADGILKKLEVLVDLTIAGNDRAADRVAVSVDVFRRGVDDDVGAEGQRLLQQRRGERVVDDGERSGLFRQPGTGLNVGDLQERVRRRLQPQKLRVALKRGGHR